MFLLTVQVLAFFLIVLVMYISAREALKIIPAGTKDGQNLPTKLLKTMAKARRHWRRWQGRHQRKADKLRRIIEFCRAQADEERSLPDGKPQGWVSDVAKFERQYDAHVASHELKPEVGTTDIFARDMY